MPGYLLALFAIWLTTIVTKSYGGTTYIVNVRESLKKWRFGFLLFMILCALVFEPIFFGPKAASWIFDVVYSLLLVSAVYAVSERDRDRTWYVVIGTLTLSATWIYHVVPLEFFSTAMFINHGMGICFLLLIVSITIKGLFAADRISFDIVLGTLAGYLLLGVAWALSYSMLHLVSPDAFAFGEEFREIVANHNSRLSAFVYYSFVTLTTLGFGDITPVSQAARTLSWLEAVAGQFYIATLVAGIVGIIASGNSERRSSSRKEMVGSQKTPDTAKPKQGQQDQ